MIIYVPSIYTSCSFHFKSSHCALCFSFGKGRRFIDKNVDSQRTLPKRTSTNYISHRSAPVDFSMSNFNPRFGPPPHLGGGGPGLLPHPPGGPPRPYGSFPPGPPRPPPMPPRPPLMPTPPPSARMPLSMGAGGPPRPPMPGMPPPPPQSSVGGPPPSGPSFQPPAGGESNRKFDQFYSEVKQIEARDAVMTPTQQIDRLLRPGSTYFNLNPFEVLQVWCKNPSLTM